MSTGDWPHQGAEEPCPQGTGDWAPFQVKAFCREPAWGIPPVTRSCGKSSDGKANQTPGFPPGISWASTPQKIRICLLFHSSDILWKKSTQGFSLLHLKGVFQLKPLWLLSSLPNRFPGPLNSLWIAYSPPTARGTKLESILKIQSLF